MPTRSQLESALRNADQAGDIDAARQIANALKAGDYSAEKAGENESSFVADAGRGLGLGLRSAIEGAAGLPAAVADLAAYPVNAAARAITGEPLIPSYRNTLSQGLTDAGLPAPSSNTERLLDATTRGVASIPAGLGVGSLLSRSASPLVAGTGDILRSAPGVQAVAGGSAGLSSESARQAGAGPEMQQIAGLVGGLAGGGVASALSPATATAARLPAGSATTAPEAAASRTLDANAEQAAQAGAIRIGLDWSAIDDGLRDNLRNMARQALQTGSDLPPEAIARAAVYQSVGITPTRALITRNFSDALNEQNLLTAPEGEAIRRIYQQNNQAIREQIQSLRPEGVQPVGQQAFGERFRAPVATGERRVQAQANDANRAAEAAEGGNPTTIQPVVNYLQENAPLMASMEKTRPVVAYLRQIGAISDDNMQPTEGGQGYRAMDISLRELAGLRDVVNRSWRSATNSGDDAAAAPLNQIRGMINEAEQSAGGELYQAYRLLRTAKGNRFENNPLIDNLLSDKKGYRNTPQIEDSEVFNKAVLGSSPEQLQTVWPRLLPRARDLTRAQVADWIEQRVYSNMASNERGDVVASAAKLNQALAQLGPEKTRLIFGARQANRLETLRNAVREISNPPRGTMPQGSAPKLEFLTRSILGVMRRTSGVPLGLGDIAAGIGGMVQQGAAARANQAAVNRAVNILAPIPASQQIQPLLERTLPPSLAGILEQQGTR
jgi:hypothetical protein